MCCRILRSMSIRFDMKLWLNCRSILMYRKMRHWWAHWKMRWTHRRTDHRPKSSGWRSTLPSSFFTLMNSNEASKMINSSRFTLINILWGRRNTFCAIPRRFVFRSPAFYSSAERASGRECKHSMIKSFDAESRQADGTAFSMELTRVDVDESSTKLCQHVLPFQDLPRRIARWNVGFIGLSQFFISYGQTWRRLALVPGGYRKSCQPDIKLTSFVSIVNPIKNWARYTCLIVLQRVLQFAV
jgi:hypothetical protein